MRIECPTCETGFNVSDDQVGQKGLCPKCQTKFIIPSDPDGSIEVLAEGKIPKEKKPSKPKSEELDETLREDEADGPKKEKRKKKPADTTGLLDDGEDDDEFDAGGAGKAIGLLAIGLVIGLAIGFVLGQMTAGGKDNGNGSDDPKPGPAVEGDTVDPFGLE